jgi:MOSC domain
MEGLTKWCTPTRLSLGWNKSSVDRSSRDSWAKTSLCEAVSKMIFASVTSGSGGSGVLQVTAPRGPCYKPGIRIGRQAGRTVIREEGLIGWHLRVPTPGVVPVAGPITLVERHPAGVTVGMAHRAVQDVGNSYPELAALEVMSINMRRQVLRKSRDITGGVPEDD